MSKVNDQTTDLNGQELHRILSVYPLPDFVKNASQQDVCGGGDLPPHLYADMTRRHYPIHSGPATVISSIFFQEKKAELNKHHASLIESKLEKAAEYFKVTGYMRRLTEKVAAASEYDETALPDNVFAIVFDAGDGTNERHYPMRNAKEVKTAAAWLQDHRDELPFADRRKVAEKVLEKASEFGAGLPEHRYMLEKTACMGACAGKDVAAMLRTRIRAAGNTHQPSEIQQEMEKLAGICENSPGGYISSLGDIASIVDAFDGEHNLRGRYDDVIERPEDVLFAVTGKAARDAGDSVIGSPLTGKYYKRDDLQKVAVQSLADNLGDDFTDEVCTAGAWVDIEKLANIVPTLPLGDAELFDEVVSEAGIAPFATKSASVGRSISAAEQVSMAEQHKPKPGSLWDKLK